MFVSMRYERFFRVCRGNRSRKQLKQGISVRIVAPLLAYLRVAVLVIQFCSGIEAYVVVDDYAPTNA